MPMAFFEAEGTLYSFRLRLRAAKALPASCGDGSECYERCYKSLPYTGQNFPVNYSGQSRALRR